MSNSFTIKCDKCGHVVKFCKGTRRHNHKSDRPIFIYTKGEGDVPDWTVLKCSVCGNEEEEI